MRLFSRFLGFQRMVAFVDLFLEDEEHDQTKQCGTGGDQQQVGIVGGVTGSTGDGTACEGVGAEQAADDGNADGRRYVHSQIVHADATTRFVLLNGAEHGGNDWRVHKATARVEHACAQGQHHKTGVHAECRAGPSQEHEGACGHDAGLDADLADDHAGAGAHHSGDHEGPHDVQGNLGGGHAVDVGTNGIEDRAQCVVHEVEHEDQTDGAQPTGVLEERRGDERVGGLVDVEGECHEQQQGDHEHPPGHVGEEQGQERGGEAEDHEAERVDLLAVAALGREGLEQDRQEQDGDGRDQEQELPCDGAEHAGREHADGSGQLVCGGEQAEEDDLQVVAQVFGGHHQEGGACHLLACGLQHSSDDHGPQVRGEEIVGHETEDGADEQGHEAEGDELLQGDEVTEGSIDEAHDAEHDAGERGDEGRLRRRADVGADLLEHEVESLQAQGAEHEGDQQRNKGADGHLVAGHRIVERVDGGLRWCGVDCRCGCVAGRHVSSSFASSLGFCDVVLRLFRW